MTGHHPWPPGKRIWYVFDAMSGGVVDERYFSTKVEAVHFRNKLSYGYVKSMPLQDGGAFDVDGKQLIGG